MPGLLDQFQTLDPQTQAALIRQIQANPQVAQQAAGLLNVQTPQAQTNPAAGLLSQYLPQQQVPQPQGFMDKLMAGVQSPMFRMGQGMDMANSQHRGLGNAVQGGVQALQAYPTEQIQGQALQSDLQNKQMETLLNATKLKQALDPNYLSREDKGKMYDRAVEVWKAQLTEGHKGYFMPGQGPKEIPPPNPADFGLTLPNTQSFNFPPMTADQAKMSPNPQTAALVQHAVEQFPNVDPILAHAVIHAESNGNPNAVSKTGAQGLMQLEPGTAKDMGVTDPFDPAQNIVGGVKYLSKQLAKYGNDPFTALAAYNWGPGHVDKWLSAGADPSKLPHETQNYIAKIMGHGVDLAEHQHAQMAQNTQSPQQTDAQGPQMPSSQQMMQQPAVQQAMQGVGNIPQPAPQQPPTDQTVPQGQLPVQQPEQQQQYIPLNDAEGTPVLKDGKQLYQNTATGQREWRSGLAGGLINDSNANLSGDALLATLPKDKALLVPKIASGEYMPSGRSQDKNDLIAAAIAYEPGLDATQIQARQKTRNSYSGGADHQTLVRAATALNTLAKAKEKSDILGGPQFLNSVRNAALDAKSDPNLKQYENYAKSGADETATFVGAGSSAESDRKARLGLLTADQAPAARTASIQAQAQEIYAKLAPLAGEYNKTMGTNITPQELLQLTDPEAAKSFAKIMGDAEQAAKSAPASDGWKITVRKP